MSLGLTLTIIFGVIFAIALFVGFLYEKELAEFERIVFKYIKLKIYAYKSGISVEEYVNAKKSAREKAYANVIRFDDHAA